MAEFKLGRIRFVWKGDWSGTTTYYKDDVVRYGGRTYICAEGHIAAVDFYTDLNFSPSKWNQMTDGQTWKGDWNTSTSYDINDLVKYGGTLYLCTTAHTSAATSVLGLEADQGKWDVYADGLDWKSIWTPATRYKVNDLVRYGGYTYVCNAYHTSAATDALGLEADQSKWDEFNQGIEYKGTWITSTRYKLNDVVKYGAGLWICSTPHTSANFNSDSSNWSQFVEGYEFEDSWNIATAYQAGDIVIYGGNQYVAKTNHSGAVPSTSTTNWDLINEGFDFAGDWSDIAAYRVGQVVRLRGYTYLCTSDNTNQEPPNLSYWERLNSGLQWQGEWVDDVLYKLGDVVRYGSNVYTCVQAHRSEGDDGSTIGPEGGGAANSRPDQDVTGTYWNLLSIGTEVSVMTEIGDMVYFSGSGPTRLPIGKEGQILRAGTQYPEWVTFGDTDHLYFVAPHGEDLPAPIHGKTVDKPWKTIRYACQQVERGPRNPEAQKLLKLNRVFIQREVVEWVDRQISTGGSGFSLSFDYDEYKCERDVGFIVDALVHDIGHGGNVKMRGAANSYVGGLSATEIEPYGVGLANEDAESVAALNYMLTVVEAVLNQEAPAVNYQVLNGDNSTAVVEQYFDSNLNAEAGVIDTITDLVSIVTDAITAGNADNIPARSAPTNLIKVKTGQYREILPIIVPEQTCVQGDELRSTNAGPRVGTTAIEDAKYSIGALDRMSAIVGDILVGSTVTKTVGNAESQDIAVPFSTAEDVAATQQLIRTIQHNIDYRLGTKHLSYYTNPTGYNVGYLSGYGDARKLIANNKKFFQEEVTAYITDNYPSVKYSKTKCKRDVGYIVDALVYDLTYGGNSQTVSAGFSYYEGVSLVIDGTEKTATVAAYNYLKTLTTQAALNNATGGLQSVVPQYRDTAGSGTASSFIDSLMTEFVSIVNTGTNGVTVTDIASNVCTTSAAHNLEAGDSFTPSSTANGLTAGVKYWVLSTPGAQSFTLSTTFGGSTAVLVDGTGLTIAGTTMNYPAATDGVSSTTALIAAFTALDAAQETIVSNTTSFIAAQYPDLVYDSAKCERDVRIVLESLGFDFMLNSNIQTLNAGYAYLRGTASDVYDLGQKTATRDAYIYAISQAISNVGGNATAQSRLSALSELFDDILFSGSVEGSRCATDRRAVDYAILQLERNREFIVNEIDAWISDNYSDTATNTTSSSNLITISDTSWLQRNTAIKFLGTAFGGLSADTTYYVQKVVSGTTFTVGTTRNSTSAVTLTTDTGTLTVELVYNSQLCLRDVNEYIDALQYDLQYEGNYRSLWAARAYSNSVVGSLEEDMFYLRDATGLRDMTLEGLSGDLLAPNSLGTSRVSAGSYASLDPGWGPEDYRAWINTRSPYVQGVTTIGTACVGQKIDGALHNGGNDSIVSNDFTQVLSDGIGAWVANNGRAELVSVFTYYCHIGYLSTEGGRIRGTNGNNSYGDFGSVAEGFDATETPGEATVDNRFQFVSTIGSVLTDGDEILQFEYNNAGINYTEVEYTITGGGVGADVEPEFRDDGVYEVRLLDPSDNFGGADYLTNANTAQGGTTTSITIAATDGESATAYPGMKVLLTGGAGVGQYAIINTYNNGTKLASVIKESDGSPGWDHVVAGTTIVAPDASSTYVIEPALSFSAPGFTATTRTLSSSLAYSDVVYATHRVDYAALSHTGGNGTGATFNVAKKGTKYVPFVADGGTGYERLDVLTIAGTSLGGASTANDLTITVTAINTTTGEILDFDWEGTGSGGFFVAVADSSDNAVRSTNGTTWVTESGVLSASTAWSAIVSGRLLTNVAAGDIIAGKYYKITDLGNSNWLTFGARTAVVGEEFFANDVGAGTGTALVNEEYLVAVAENGTVNYSSDAGATWSASSFTHSGTLVSDVAYGNGIWMAIVRGSDENFYSTDGGANWSAGGTTTPLVSDAWTSIAYGKGVWVAVATGGTVAASSTNNGLTWTARTLPSSGNWTSVTYGNNRFVAVANGGTAAAYSLDGETWVAATLPASSSWNAVEYGQGVFMAVTAGTQAATSEDGIVWTSRTMSSAPAGYSRAVFGNPNNSGIWSAVQAGVAGTVGCSVLTGARAKARSFVSEGKIFAIRITEPGSGYLAAPTLTVTDPNNTVEVPHTVRIGKGSLANPSMINRGSGYGTGSAEIASGDGYADLYQPGSFVAVRRITKRPVAGSNVVFSHLPDRTFKLVNVITFLGENDGAYTAFFQVSPSLTVSEAPDHLEDVSTRIRYSQVRLTGHDFLDIGTGGFEDTNYPGTPFNDPVPANETQEGNGGRVFFTSTDQDGNFRVGDLFAIEQSTGIATLNADAFNIAGLQELNLGEVTLGGGSATVTEFSTDPFFTADSDNVVPTQRAIKAYIAAQIGGGGASLNVNSVTAGSIVINSDQITHVGGLSIKMNATFEFRGGVTGIPLAFNYFLT